LRFHHIGYLVSSLEESEKPLGLLNATPISGVIADTDRGVLIQFYGAKPGETNAEAGPLIELIQPTDAASPMANLLQKRKAGPYHLCYSGSAQDERDLLENGFIMIQTPAPAIAFDGRKVGFYYSNAIGLIELLFDAEE